MKCNAKTRSGTVCQKSPLQGKGRCRLHGGMSPSGKQHWNFKHGECTIESRARHREVASKLKLLELLAHKYMLIDK
jgi:hypothetical protein